MVSRFLLLFFSEVITVLGEAAYVQRRRIHEKRHRDAIQGKKQEEQVWWRPRPIFTLLLGLFGMDVGVVFDGGRGFGCLGDVAS